MVQALPVFLGHQERLVQQVAGLDLLHGTAEVRRCGLPPLHKLMGGRSNPDHVSV